MQHHPNVSRTHNFRIGQSLAKCYQVFLGRPASVGSITDSYAFAFQSQEENNFKSDNSYSQVFRVTEFSVHRNNPNEPQTEPKIEVANIERKLFYVGNGNPYTFTISLISTGSVTNRQTQTTSEHEYFRFMFAVSISRLVGRLIASTVRYCTR